MKKAALVLLVLVPALCLAMDGPPVFVKNSAVAGKHKLYSTSPGDMGEVSVVQVTAPSADVQISFHNYTRGTKSTADDSWRPVEILSYVSAVQDTSYTIYAGETVEFTFVGPSLPEAYFTSGGSCRVWAR